MVDEEIVVRLTKVIEDTHNKREVRIKEALDEHMSSSHHTYVQTMMDKEHRKKEIWDKVQGNIIFWFVVGGASVIGKAMWEYFKNINGPHGP